MAGRGPSRRRPEQTVDGEQDERGKRRALDEAEVDHLTTHKPHLAPGQRPQQRRQG